MRYPDVISAKNHVLDPKNALKILVLLGPFHTPFFFWGGGGIILGVFLGPFLKKKKLKKKHLRQKQR